MAPSRDHLIYRACVAAGFEPRIAFVTRDPLAIGELVGAGLAVTLAPELLAGRLATSRWSSSRTRCRAARSTRSRPPRAPARRDGVRRRGGGGDPARR